MTSHPKRPRDPNQLAKSIIDIATGQKPDRDPTPEEQGKDPAAVALGRKGGLAWRCAFGLTYAGTARRYRQEGGRGPLEEIAHRHLLFTIDLNISILRSIWSLQRSRGPYEQLHSSPSYD